ncbi:MAG: outer membrane beta-barrel protein [Acidobacteria bacterium]|nr:outer membrane beta-barrel protein [Acidobacteriota bacterium]
MKAAARRVLPFVLLAAVVLSARAETWKGLELQRRISEAPWHFGPFKIQPSLVITNAGVDSNVFYSPAEPVKDFTVTAGPAATVYVPIHRKFVLTAYGSPQYVWYSKTERERTWNYYFAGAAQLSLKNVFLSAEGGYSDARERWSTEIDIRPRRKETVYGGSMLVNLAHRTSFGLGGRTVKYDYESVVYEGGFDVQERLNRRESYANLSLFYQASTQRRVFLDLEYGQYDFEFETQAALGDARSGAAYAGLEFSRLGRRVRGRVRLGYKIYDVRAAAGPDYKGLVGDTQLSVRLARPFVVRGSYLRDVRFSLWYGNPYYIESRPGAGASLYVLRFLRFDYDYSVGRNRYPVAGGGGPDEKRLDDFTVHSGAVYVRIRKNVALGFVASWWARDSNLAAEDDKRTFFGVNLTYEF